MSKSTITIDIHLDEQKVPEQINWSATDSTAEMMQPAKSMMVAFWDAQEKAALRIDLWTKDMMVDEMADFYYQTFMGMADTYLRATKNEALTKELKAFAKVFHQKANDALEAAEK